MIRDLVLIAIILAGAALVLAAVEYFGRRFDLIAEVKRKILHFSLGVVSLSFPWLFSEIWPVAAICTVILATLAAIRFWRPLRQTTGRSLYDVGRDSLGEFLFPISVALLFALGQHERILYLIPILVLTTADAGAALVALRYGLSPFATLDGSKSWEGTAIFFFTAFIAALVPLLILSDVGRSEVLLISCLIGFVGCVIEASSWHGLDNFFVPVGMYVVLNRYLRLEAIPLLTEFIILVGLLLLVMSWSRRTRLDTQASFSTLAVGFILWTISGTVWLIPAVTVFLLHPLLVRLPRNLPHTTDLRSVLSVMGSAIPWFIMYEADILDFEPAYYGYCVTFATQLSMVSVARTRELAAETEERPDIVGLSLFSTYAFGLLYLLHTPGDPDTPLTTHRMVVSSLIWPFVMLATYIFDRLTVRYEFVRRWALEGVIAFLASSASMIVRLVPGL